MYPEDLKYKKTHEWVKVEGNTAKVGITSFAIAELTDLTYLEYKVDEGDTVKEGDMIAEVESVKTTGDIYAPVSGKIVAVNQELPDLLDELMEDPFETGWMIQIEMSDSSECDSMMSSQEYAEHTESPE